MSITSISNGTINVVEPACAVFSPPSAPGSSGGGPGGAPFIEQQSLRVYHLDKLPSFIVPPDFFGLAINTSTGTATFNGKILNGPASYSGLKYYRFRAQEFSYDFDTVESGGTTLEYTWNATTLEVDADSGTTGPWETFIDEVEEHISGPFSEDYLDANPGATDEEIKAALQELFTAGSSYTESSFTVTVTYSGKSFTYTETLSDEDTWADIQSRAADISASTDDAVWGSSSGDSWVAVDAPQAGHVYFRPANPSGIADRTQRYAIALRYAHYLPYYPSPPEFDGVWEHYHRQLTYTGCPPTIQYAANPANRDDGTEAEQTVARVRTITDTYSEEIVGRFYDELGLCNDPDDLGWVGLPWVYIPLPGAPNAGERNISWGDVQGVRRAVLRARIVAIDGRAGWECALSSNKTPSGSVSFNFTTASGGASNEEFIPRHPGGVFQTADLVFWSGAPSLTNLVSPEGGLVSDSSVGLYIRLEYQIRLSVSADWEGSTNLWYKANTRVIEDARTAEDTNVPFATPATDQFQRHTRVFPGFDSGSVVTTEPREYNGTPVDEDDALQRAPMLWTVTGSPDTVITPSESGEITVITYDPVTTSNGSARGFCYVQAFPVGWEGAPTTPPVYGQTNISLTENTSLLGLAAAPAGATLSVTPITSTMVRESRIIVAPSSTRLAWWSDWQYLTLTDEGIVTVIPEGWATWTP